MAEVALSDDRRPTPVLRPAARGEARAVADVWLRSRKASVPAIPPAVHTDDEVRAWFTEVVMPSHEIWVADAAGTLVAMMVLDAGSIDQLYVDPDWTGQGLGAQLLGWAKVQHPAGLDLCTFQSNRAARRFYESHGFVVVDTTEGANEEGAPDVRYRWAGPSHHRS